MDMKSLFNFICNIMLLVAFSNICISCSDDALGGGSSAEDIVDALNKVSTEWNASKDQIQTHMSGYMLVDSDDDFLKYSDKNGTMIISYNFVHDSLRASVAIAPRLADINMETYLEGFEELGELSSKKVYYNVLENTMCFPYNINSNDEDYSVIGFAPINSNLYEDDIKIKVDYENLSYSIDGDVYKMILVDGGVLPAFYMMQTELPLLGSFQIANTLVGPIDTNSDNCISKAELRKFIRKLNEITGLEFRLPTESEWKFAAQGGSKSQGYTYSGSNNIDDVAWYSGNSSSVHDIAEKQPNELGFYDMSGNYAEVCSSDPVNIDGRTYGGCWKYSAANCTPTSWRSGDDSREDQNKVDGKYITVRFVYSIP